MSDHLEIGVEGRLGVIALNRPQAINALSREMIAGISAQLEAWRGDDAIRAVLFEGRGERGFCSGGDVRSVRTHVAEGRIAEADAFFVEEYAMNGLIANYEKPVVAICDGIVMGGGIGIAGHADFRFATTNVRYAMPEAAIGFVSDVGSNFILSRAPLNRALLFLMTGMAVGAGDARALGLTDCVIKPDVMADARQGVKAAAEAGEVDTALVGLMQRMTIEPEEPALCLDADRLEAALQLTEAADIVGGIAELEAADGTNTYSHLLQTRCPTSLCAIVMSHHAARHRQSIAAVLEIDRRIASHMSKRADFAEGVRAVLVDKDGPPDWDPPGFDAVDREAIGRAIEGQPAIAA
jgi:enoyl-CoA hydratase